MSLLSLFSPKPERGAAIKAGDWVRHCSDENNPWPDDFQRVLEIKNGYARWEIYNKVRGKLVKFNPPYELVIDELTLRANYSPCEAPAFPLPKDSSK